MSVVIKNSNENQFFSYCKGSPEVMHGLFEKSSVPTNYNKVLKSYSSKGYRILAIGSKKVSFNSKITRKEV
jgi:cation-transporting ATPase 13A2